MSVTGETDRTRVVPGVYVGRETEGSLQTRRERSGGGNEFMLPW